MISAGTIPVLILLLFIVTIKYLSAITIPIVIISAYGISKIEDEILRKRIVSCLIFGFTLITAIYFISFLQEGARG